MNWLEAKRRTIEQWRWIRDRIGTADVLELVEDVNGVTALCEKAQQDAASVGDWHKCRFCIAYDQLGGCGAVEGVLTECLLDHNLTEARDLANRILGDLESLEVPEEG